MREHAIDAGPGAPGLVLEAAGELDVASVPELRGRLRKAIGAGATGIVVDLTEVTYIDSLSLAALIAARAELPPPGRLAVVATTPFVRLILEATALDAVLDVFADREAAERFAFGSRGSAADHDRQ